MDSEMAEEVKEEVVADEAADEDQLLAEDSEMTEAAAEGEGEHVKTEEELEEELKETKITIPRYSPHTMPDWKLDEMRTRWPWHLRIYPIDQEDCRNCILDTVTKISQEAWYYVPKRKNGEGIAELCMSSMSEAKSVMARVIRMPFYHNYVTIEINKRKKAEGMDDSQKALYLDVEESATIVYDTVKCEKIKNTASSKGGVKRRTLWVRYLSEDTTPELLRVVFPFAQTSQVHTQEDLRIGEIKTNSKTDVLLIMKGYLTVLMNNQHILALQNKELAENEQAIKDELDKSVTPVDSLEVAPTSVAERSEQRKDDKNLSARVLKRTLQQQQKIIDSKRKDPMMRNRQSGEPPAKRGGRGNWGDRFDGRRQGGGGGGGGGRFGGGYPGGPGGMPYGAGPRGPGGYGGGMLDPHGMAAEMMMMQAQLNQTIQNQLMMLNPGGGGGGGGGGGYGGRKDGRRGGGGRGGGRKW